MFHIPQTNFEYILKSFKGYGNTYILFTFHPKNLYIAKKAAVTGNGCEVCVEDIRKCPVLLAAWFLTHKF
jgi:hypothetical protein